MPAVPQPEPPGPAMSGGHAPAPAPGPSQPTPDPWYPPSVPQVNIGPPPLVPPAPGPGPSLPNKPIIDTWTPPMPQHPPQTPGPAAQTPGPAAQPPGARINTVVCVDGLWVNSDGRKLGPCGSGSQQAGSGQAKGGGGSGTKQASLPPGEDGKKPQPLPVKPALPTLPVKPAQPTLPIKPAQPTLPIKPAQPTLPVQPAQQTLPVQPAEPRVAKAEPQPAPAPAASPQPAKREPQPGQQAKREEPEPPPVKPDCQKRSVHFRVENNDEVTVPVTIIGGAKCSHRYWPEGPDVHLTAASIASEPSNGTLTQTGDFTFEYVPEAGAKDTDSDEYAIEVCGDTNRGSGCATMTYQITFE